MSINRRGRREKKNRKARPEPGRRDTKGAKIVGNMIQPSYSRNVEDMVPQGEMSEAKSCSELIPSPLFHSPPNPLSQERGGFVKRRG